jgi:hypothetical protein
MWSDFDVLGQRQNIPIFAHVLDKNSDGMVSQDDFIAIIQQYKSLLGGLEGKAQLVLKL